MAILSKSGAHSRFNKFVVIKLAFLIVGLLSCACLQGSSLFSLEQAFDQYSIVLAGRVIQGKTVDEGGICGMSYEVEVAEVLSGDVETSNLTFVSWEPLSIGSSYVLFLNKVEPYRVPSNLELTEGDRRTKYNMCSVHLTKPIPEYSAGWFPVSMEFVDSIKDLQSRWLEYDSTRYSLPAGLSDETEVFEICIEEGEGQQNCVTARIRKLIKWGEFLKFFASGRKE